MMSSRKNPTFLVPYSFFYIITFRVIFPTYSYVYSYVSNIWHAIFDRVGSAEVSSIVTGRPDDDDVKLPTKLSVSGQGPTY